MSKTDPGGLSPSFKTGFSLLDNADELCRLQLGGLDDERIKLAKVDKPTTIVEVLEAHERLHSERSR